MIDLETLGTTSDSVILSIGAVRFDENGIDDNAFYCSVSIDSNLAAGRKISEDTLIWWMNQSKEAQKVFNEPKIVLSEALYALRDFMPQDNDCLVWSNGADFDIPMLTHAFKQMDIEVPWKFYNVRCYRTMKALAPHVKVPRLGVHHDALADAVYQASHLVAIHQQLRAAPKAA